MVTQMAWETAKVSRAFSLLSSLLRPVPPHPHPALSLRSLLTHSLSFLSPPFPPRLPSPFCGPVCSTLTILLSFSLLHPSVPLGSRPPASFPLLCLWSPPTPPCSTPLSQTGCCVHSGSFFADRCESAAETLSRTQGETFFTCVSLKAHLQTQNKTWLFAQSASKVLKGLFSPK